MKEDIQKLRSVTGAGVMDCKKALEDAKGDFNQALENIKKQGLAKADKKSDRETGSGLIYSYIHNERVGVLLKLKTETDFAARADTVKNLAHDLVMQIAAMDPESVDELLKQVFIKDESMSVEDFLKQVIAKTGENIKIENFCRYEI